MNYPAVDAAEREEHNSFDHSIGTDSGLTETAGNEFSEGLVSSRRNVLDLYKATQEIWNTNRGPNRAARYFFPLLPITTFMVLS